MQVPESKCFLKLELDKYRHLTLQLQNWEGKEHLDIRVWRWHNGAKDHLPTKYGVKIPKANLQEFGEKVALICQSQKALDSEITTQTSPAS